MRLKTITTTTTTITISFSLVTKAVVVTVVVLVVERMERTIGATAHLAPYPTTTSTTPDSMTTPTAASAEGARDPRWTSRGRGRTATPRQHTVEIVRGAKMGQRVIAIKRSSRERRPTSPRRAVVVEDGE